MAKSIAVKPKKRGRPATGRDPLVGVRMPAALTVPLDRWIATQNPCPSRSEAIRVIIKDWLIGQGIIPFHEAGEGDH